MTCVADIHHGLIVRSQVLASSSLFSKKAKNLTAGIIAAEALFKEAAQIALDPTELFELSRIVEIQRERIRVQDILSHVVFPPPA